MASLLTCEPFRRASRGRVGLSMSAASCRLAEELKNVITLLSWNQGGDTNMAQFVSIFIPSSVTTFKSRVKVGSLQCPYGL